MSVSRAIMCFVNFAISRTFKVVLLLVYETTRGKTPNVSKRCQATIVNKCHNTSIYSASYNRKQKVIITLALKRIMADQNKGQRFDNVSLENPTAQLYLIERLNAIQRGSMDLLRRNNEQNCTQSQNSTIVVENHRNDEIITDENSTVWNRGTSQNDTPTAEPATPQEHTHCRKKNCHKQSESYLISKMSQEDSLHKKALRKFAELELQRKVLEVQRSQWKFQRDKYQSEVRWAYDLRVLQYREEQVKRNAISDI